MTMLVAILTFMAVLAVGFLTLSGGSSPQFEYDVRRISGALLTLSLAFLLLILACALSWFCLGDTNAVFIVSGACALILIPGTCFAFFKYLFLPPPENPDPHHLPLTSADHSEEPSDQFPWSPKVIVYGLTSAFSMLVGLNIILGSCTLSAVLYASAALLLLMVLSVFICAACSCLRYPDPFPLSFSSIVILAELTMLSVALFALANNLPNFLH